MTIVKVGKSLKYAHKFGALVRKRPLNDNFEKYSSVKAFQKKKIYDKNTEENFDILKESILIAFSFSLSIISRVEFLTIKKGC